MLFTAKGQNDLRTIILKVKIAILAVTEDETVGKGIFFATNECDCAIVSENTQRIGSS